MFTMKHVFGALATAGADLLLSWMVSSSSQSTAEEPNAGKIDSEQVTQSAKAALKVRLFSQHYETKCALLSFKVYFENTSAQPIYLISNDFSFVRGHPLETGQRLVCDEKADELILDLSHTMPTAEGTRYFRSEAGTYGFIPEVIEIGPNRFRYMTYVFQFPLKLDYRISETESIPVPLENRKVSLCFGYAREPFESFSKREFKQTDSIEEWQQRIGEDWQERSETEPVSVQFAK